MESVQEIHNGQETWNTDLALDLRKPEAISEHRLIMVHISVK